MATALTVISLKGGVGKTTVSLNLAVAMALRGRNTLLADLDPQGGIGHALARPDAELRGLADLLMRQVAPQQAILKTTVPHLSLLPRGRLDPVQIPAFEEAMARGALPGALRKVQAGFDLLVIDTPAGLGPSTRAALAFSRFTLVATQAEPMALRSVGQVLRVVEHVKSRENPGLQLLGVLPTMVDRHASGGTGLAELPGGLASALTTVIPRSEAIGIAAQRGVPLALLDAPHRNEASHFSELALEVETLMEKLGREAPALGHALGARRE